MIIDFHTHIFPDKIAKKTIDLLAEKASIPPFSDGSVAGLLAELERAGVDVAVTLPVLTNPERFESINRFACEINAAFSDKSRRLISFGAIHPACEDIEGKMRLLREQGFFGVKIHPDYQGTFIDDEGYVKILECARALDMIVVTHAGVDGGYRDFPVRCTPERALRLIRGVPHGKLVLAHMGGNELFSDVYDMLCGEDVYLDTAYVLRFIGKEMFTKILKKHGEDKILFASDSPWSSIEGGVDILRSYGLDKNVEEKLLCTNARLLLGI